MLELLPIMKTKTNVYTINKNYTFTNLLNKVNVGYTQQVIEAILLDIPLPEVTLYTVEAPHKYEILTGAEMLSAILSYINDRSDSLFESQLIGIKNLNRYTNLSPMFQNKIDDFNITFNIVRSLDKYPNKDKIIELIKGVNK